jgi:hypothetical protein
MSAESFIVYYGLRWEVQATEKEQVTRLEKRQDPRQLGARQHGLDFWWGRTLDEETFFVLLGKQVGPFGFEGESLVRLNDAELEQITTKTRERLQAAEFADPPTWYYQFEPDW